MTQKLFYGNSHKLSELVQRLDDLEQRILEYKLTTGLFDELSEIGCQVNELLQYRISYADQQFVLKLIKRIKYLYLFSFRTVVKLQANKLAKELQEMVSPHAWQVFLRLDELRGIEISTLQGNYLFSDHYFDLLSLQQELKTILAEINLQI